MNFPTSSYYLGYGPNTMLHCFPHRDEYVLKEYCSKLSSVFSTIGDFPLIRFQKDSIDSWCSTLAMALNDELDKYWGDATKEPNKLPCCCLIVDRSIDPVTPFMHDFGMEALAFDLLGGQDDPEKAINMNTDVYSYTGQSGTGEEMAKKVPLNDDLWRSLRHRSVLDAKDMVMEQMQQLQETSEVAKFMAAEAAGRRVMFLLGGGEPTKSHVVSRTSVCSFGEVGSKISMYDCGSCTGGVYSLFSQELSATLDI